MNGLSIDLEEDLTIILSVKCGYALRENPLPVQCIPATNKVVSKALAMHGVNQYRIKW